MFKGGTIRTVKKGMLEKISIRGKEMKKYLIINISVFAQMNNKENTIIETTYEEIVKIADLLTKFENKFYIIDVETETIIFGGK